MPQKDIKPFTYLLHALLIFCLLGLEFAVLPLSSLVDGRPASQMFSWAVNWYGAVAHWIITMLIWSTGIFFYYRWAKQRDVLNELLNFRFFKREGVVLAIGLLFVLVYTVVHSEITGTSIPQIYREYTGFQKMYGSQAWITSIFQNLYYAVEFTLVVMMTAFFQRAGELWFKNNIVPWGSIGLIFTWGMIHLVSHPQGALGVMIWSLVPGVALVAAKKSFLPVFLISVLGFIF